MLLYIKDSVMISDLLFREWKNVKGQISLVIHSLHWTEAYLETQKQMVAF